MQAKVIQLTSAILAGLLGGAVAVAESSSTTAVTPAQPTGAQVGGNPSTSTAQRKPHKEIKNKMKCCKNGCDCMSAKKQEGAEVRPSPKDQKADQK